MITTQTLRWILVSTLCCCTVFVTTSCAAPEESAAPLPPVLAEYERRLDHVRQQIPQIVTAAEAVAAQRVDSDKTLLHYPFGGDTSNFTMEFIARAGGVDNAQPNTLRRELRSQHDVIVVAPRSWDTGATFLNTELPKAREQGWMIVAFASTQGMPADLPVDFLIDNGAADGTADEAAMNQIINMTSGWIWSCELTAALTRLGHRPGILKGMTLPGSTAHNAEYQNTNRRPKLYPCDTPIPAGQLAEAYLFAMEQEIAGLAGDEIQDQIARAADLSAAHIKAGKELWATSFTHVLDGEVFANNKSPIRAFRGISCGPNGEFFIDNLNEDTLLLFFGEWTLNLPWRDYLELIRATGTDYIPSYRPINEPMEPCEGDDVFYDTNTDDALMVLEQHWPYENAVVPIPFAPGKMAPVSGVYVCLMYRMLDEAIAMRLAEVNVEAADAQP